MRVYELAKELGVDSKTLMERLGECGEFVRSASSTIEPATVQKLRAANADVPVSVEPAWPNSARPAIRPRRWSGTATPRQWKPVRTVRSGDLDAAEQVFGTEAVRRVREGSGGGPFGRDGYDLSWKKYFIDREVYEQFMDAGLGYEQAQLAAECLAAGLGPEDLAVGLGDRTVLSWLRDGHAAAQVAKTLRECREDPGSAHLVVEPPRRS